MRKQPGLSVRMHLLIHAYTEPDASLKNLWCVLSATDSAANGARLKRVGRYA